MELVVDKRMARANNGMNTDMLIERNRYGKASIGSLVYWK